MKIDRLVSIIMLLLEKERISAKELADMFEVSPRTIYRDVDTINMAGVPIRATPGVSGGFEIMPQYKVDKKVFSSSDLSTILMGLSNISTMIRGDELVNTLAKVKSFIPADKARDIELRSNQVYIDMTPWMGNGNIQAYLELIKTAMQEHRILRFSYIDHRGERITRMAEAYQLVLKSSHWYWYGYCYVRQDFRMFKLSRMSEPELLAQTYVPRSYETPKLDINDIGESTRLAIKLRIHSKLMERLLDYCPYERFTPDDAEHYIVDFPFVENDYSYDILLGFGEGCECLEPEHVRAELKRRIMEMEKLYRDHEEL